jgi:hypothetical protein
MSDIERAIRLAGAIENALERRGAAGNGLREKAECFEDFLPAGVWPALKRLGWQRNQIAHGRTHRLEDPDQFEADCRFVLEAVKALPRHAVPRVPLGRPRMKSSPRSRGRREGGVGIGVAQVVIAAVVLTFAMIQCLDRGGARSKTRTSGLSVQSSSRAEATKPGRVESTSESAPKTPPAPPSPPARQARKSTAGASDRARAPALVRDSGPAPAALTPAVAKPPERKLDLSARDLDEF